MLRRWSRTPRLGAKPTCTKPVVGLWNDRTRGWLLIRAFAATRVVPSCQHSVSAHALDTRSQGDSLGRRRAMYTTHGVKSFPDDHLHRGVDAAARELSIECRPGKAFVRATTSGYYRQSIRLATLALEDRDYNRLSTLSRLNLLQCSQFA